MKKVLKPTKRCGTANRRIRKELKRLGLSWEGIHPMNICSCKLLHLVWSRNGRIQDKERLQNRKITPYAQEAAEKLGGGILRKY